MKEERIKILKMVEDGKITVDEAATLMEALRESYPFEFYGDDENDFNEKVKQFGKEAESFLKNVGGKMGGFAKEMEPKVKNITKTVVAKTAAIVEELGKALGECLNSFNTPPCEPAEKEECSCGCNEKEDEESREN